jgi:hypothetical protein
MYEDNYLYLSKSVSVIRSTESMRSETEISIPTMTYLLCFTLLYSVVHSFRIN